MYINNKHKLTDSQLQEWLLNAGISDFDYLQCLAKAKEYAELRVNDPATKVKVDADAYLRLCITAQN